MVGKVAKLTHVFVILATLSIFSFWRHAIRRFLENWTMARPLNEIFSDVSLTVDLATYEQPEKVNLILNKCNCRKTRGSIWEILGSFEELEDVYFKLSALRRSNDSWRKHQAQDYHDHGTTRVEPVPVEGPVIDYILAKYPKELERSHASDAFIQIKKPFVFFQPTHGFNVTRCHFARERFITFYQKIATDFQMRTFNIDPKLMTHYKSIESEFPDLIITRQPGRIAVTGGYTDIVRFEGFLNERAADSPRRTLTQGRGPSEASAAAVLSPPAPQKGRREKQETCPICLDTIEPMKVERLSRCQHVFCKGCLKQAFAAKPACPVCGMLYGELKGTQPEKGTMETSIVASSLPGYANYGTIIIQYCIPSGIQGEEHPHPGQRYRGTVRTAYLPDSPEGQKVLTLLKRAFAQRLTFTIGRSSTSGQSNVVTWNDVHHKTSPGGGPTNYGYPDPDYLNRVQEELKAKGIY